MTGYEPSDLLARIERLERRNRRLTLLLLCMPLLALVGWIGNDDVLRVKRLEVVDDQGVPLVTLSPARMNEGGMITLRDNAGEKRAWWQAGPGTSSFTLNTEGGNGTGDSTMGLSVGPKRAALSLLSRGGASLSASMNGDTPKVELYDAKGKTLFAAPWVQTK